MILLQIIIIHRRSTSSLRQESKVILFEEKTRTTSTSFSKMKENSPQNKECSTDAESSLNNDNSVSSIKRLRTSSQSSKLFFDEFLPQKDFLLGNQFLGKDLSLPSLTIKNGKKSEIRKKSTVSVTADIIFENQDYLSENRNMNRKSFKIDKISTADKEKVNF